MDTEDRTLLQRAIAAMRGDAHAPAREDLAKAISEHGEDDVRAAAADLFPVEESTDLTADEITELAKAATETTTPETSPTTALEDRLKGLEAKLDKLLGGTPEAASPDALTLVKSGVPPALVEQAKPLLESTDEKVQASTVALLAKSADPALRALLAKEAGSSKVPEATEETDRLVSILAKADGDAVESTPDVKKLLAQLAAAA